MSDRPFNLDMRRRPVRMSLGCLVGLLFGPLIACLLMHLPSSAWLGPHPAYVEDCTRGALILGLFCGPPVGLAVALLARLFQHWSWGGELLPGTALHAPEVDRPVLPPGPDAARADVRITGHTDMAGPSDEERFFLP